MVRILLTGGGTGGHIYPLIAVSKKLQDYADRGGLEIDLRYFGKADYYAKELETNNIKAVYIAPSKLRRYFSLLNLVDIPKFFWSILQGLWKVFWFMPDAVFSKGGPGALAMILVCRFYRIPLLIHESDAIPGLTNRISARFAKKVDIAFEAAADYFQTKAELGVTGNPIREELLIPQDQAMAKRRWGFDPRKPVILVLGGSQGSERINNFISENLEDWLNKFQLLHQVGYGKYAEYQKWMKQKSNYQFVPYFDSVKDLRDGFAAADIIVSRAGAGAIFEIAAMGKPSILIPLPEAANNHQNQNAYEYVKTGAAIIIEEENLLVNLAINEIEKILNNPALLIKMSTAAKNFYKPDAAEKIAKDIISVIK